jgi:hypothetical protein
MIEIIDGQSVGTADAAGNADIVLQVDGSGLTGRRWQVAATSCE